MEDVGGSCAIDDRPVERNRYRKLAADVEVSGDLLGERGARSKMKIDRSDAA